MFDCGTDDIGLAGWAGYEEVEITYGLTSTTERAGGGNFVNAGEFVDEVGDDVGMILGFVNAEAAGVSAMVFDAFEEFSDELFSHARELSEVTGFGSSLKRIDVADLAGGPDEGDCFRTHTREAEKLEHGGFVLLQELFAERYGASGEEGLDVGDHAFTDA
jgi:hypothetical protein